ncbi:MAG: hypothetical protein H7A25_00005 [Leptospiraceae bacterium]|nr:hypothetical protein [Leptospiraceae bacterium]MCP5498257.1 hypothetical protein [Leptospiraceae bacterium]
MQQLPPQSTAPYWVEDEISLVDLAKIFVKRRKWFYIGNLSVFLLGMAFSLTRPKIIEYRSFYQLPTESREGKVATMEPVSIVSDKFESLYIKQYINGYKKKHNTTKFPFIIKPEFEKDSNYISILSKAAEAKREEVKVIHKELLSFLSSNQEKLYTSRKDYYTKQIEKLNQELKEVEKASKNATSKELMSSYQNRISSLGERVLKLEEESSFLKSGQLLGLAEETEEKDKRVLYVAVSLIASLIIGFVLVFIAEFISQVKKALDEEM